MSGVFFDLSEANYPFESTYITSAVGPGYYPLPAWPLRVACASGLESDHDVTIEGDKASVSYTVNAAPSVEGGEGVKVAVEWDSAKGAKAYTVDEIEATAIPALLDGVREAWAVWCNGEWVGLRSGTSRVTTIGRLALLTVPSPHRLTASPPHRRLTVSPPHRLTVSPSCS